MKYEVVSKKSISYLVLEVNKLIREGWEPQGGICVETFTYADGIGIGSEKCYHQAMIKRD